MDSEKSHETDYNPFEHRNVEKPNSYLRSLANLIKSSLGSGLLAIPLAFSNAGWGVGLIGSIIIAIICGHCVYIFVETSRGCCRKDHKPLLNYSETCASVFSNGPKQVRFMSSFAGKFAELSMLLTYLGVCCIFTLLIADSIKQVIDRYLLSTDLAIQYYCLVILVPLSLMVQIRHLKWLAPFSLTANVLLFTTFIICIYYIFREEINMSDKRFTGNISRFPAFLSTVIFAMEGIGQVMPVENSMKKPEQFLGKTGVLVVAMSFILVLYSTLGLFGYLRYGDVLRGSITLNLPLEHWPAICAKVFIALSILLTYPLHFFVVIDIIMRFIKPRINEQYENITQIITRISIVWICGAVGMALPMLEQIINIVGAFFYSLLGLIIPGIIDTIFRWNDLGRYNWILIKNALIVVFGFSCLISGCTVSVMDIIAILNKKAE